MKRLALGIGLLLASATGSPAAQPPAPPRAVILVTIEGYVR